MATKLKSFSVYILTMNVARRGPSKELRESELFDLKQDPKMRPDLYAVGLQEVPIDAGTILPEGVIEDKWSEKITDIMGNYGYIRLESERTMGIILLIFVKRESVVWYTSIESQVTRTGVGNVLGNKGAVSIRMDVNGTNVIFLNCHLAAHTEKVMDRIEDYLRIVEKQKFNDNSVDNILDHDYVFWFGDLNFRLDDLPKQQIEELVRQEKYSDLLKHDQLEKARKNELAFVGFDEAEIKFPPTFKFDKETDRYDTSSKQRKPAWTDRVLWMCNTDAYEDVELSVESKQYCSVPSVKYSDHKPVVSRNVIWIQAAVSPMVSFHPISRLQVGTDSEVSYTIKKSVSTSSWDWVGLYKSMFCHARDYLTYFWAASATRGSRGGSSCQVLSLDGGYLGIPPGNYYLGYYSEKYNTLIGLSDLFELYLAPGQKFTLGDSSSSSSDEDESSEEEEESSPHNSSCSSSSSGPALDVDWLGSASSTNDEIGIFNPAFGMSTSDHSTQPNSGFDGTGFYNRDFGAPRSARRRRRLPEDKDNPITEHQV